MLNMQASPSSVNGASVGITLLKKMLEQNLDKVQPVLMPSSASGYAYTDFESYFQLTTAQIQSVLDSLASQKILEKQLFTSFISCPQCHWSNLKSFLGCPQCKSDNILRGRILEHFDCGNVDLEDKYITGGKYTCPRCKNDVKYLGTDYRSIGVKYYCSHCGHIFNQPVALMQCLKCNAFFLEEKAQEYNVYSYNLYAEEKARLNFEFGSKQLLIDLLKRRGYTVTEHAKVYASSKSGEEHTFDLLASRYDGFIEYNLCIDCLINLQQEVSLDDVFKYDTKTYDLGIHDKVLLVMPSLSEKASRFAQKQRIMVYSEQELLTLIAANHDIKELPVASAPVVFRDNNELEQYLKYCGYLVKEKAQIRGRSGVLHQIDMYARLDDGLLSHTVDIGILDSEQEVNLDQVLLFDARAFDLGVHDKVLLVSSRLSQEASKFAEQQRIKVYEFGKKN